MRVIRKVCDLLLAWYRIDRVRITPSDGRLLQLDVGDRFVLHDRVFIVQQRLVKSSDAACEVDLRLHSDEGEASLHVQRRHLTDPTEARLHRGAESQTVFDSDVLLLQSASSAPPVADGGGGQQAAFPPMDSPLPAFRVW